jgi:2-haloacid dehalogenase
MQAIAFDSYGTLFDVAAVYAALEGRVADPQGFATQWRQKQLEYSTMVSLMDRWQDFWALTGLALDYTAAAQRLALDAGAREEVLGAWHRLPLYADVAPALVRLSAAGPLAILSNGTVAMLEAVLRHNGIQDRFAQVCSADEVRVFKPSPRIYARLPQRLGQPAGEVLFATSNGWDVIGAKAAGLRVAWVNRKGMPLDPLGLEPDYEVPDLLALADRLGV